MRSPFFLTAMLPIGALLFGEGRAAAYAEKIHALVTARALGEAKSTPWGALSEKAAPIHPQALAALRLALDARGRAHGDDKLREAWRRRYPTQGAFDAWALKELLLFSPEARVFGIDRADAAAQTLLDLIAQGSRQPDDDWRNRERLAYDAARRPLRDAGGAKVPADPAILNMGSLGALSSQAHAHYGLAQVEFSENPEVLKSDPRRFAVRAGYKNGPILTLAAEMAQLHLDLSMLAHLLLGDGQDGASLSALYAGQGLHYLEDVGNQIHTVQVGLYDFFFDAFLARLRMAVLTGGGYLGRLRSLSSIGIDILTSHHTLSEKLTEKRVLGEADGPFAAEAERLKTAPSLDDAEFAARLDADLMKLGARPEQGAFAETITRALIDVSSHEGDDVYGATRAIAHPRLRREGERFDEEKDDPDAALAAPGDGAREAYARFFALQERAFRRVGTAIRRWIALEEKALAAAQKTSEHKEEFVGMVVDRLLRRQLLMLEEAEARRADYLARPPEQAAEEERAPGVLAAEIALVLLIVLGARFLLARRRRA